jgi:dihydroorotate dehydrogenase
VYGLVRPLLFALSPQTAHAVGMAGLGVMEHLAPLRWLTRRLFLPTDPRLQREVMGLVFPSPIGLAGGFDKNAARARALGCLGFGHVELGTVTAQGQEPNPTPNLFRLEADRALVNRLGFPNEGAESVVRRIERRGGARAIGVPVGVSIGKSRVVPVDPIAGVVDDYLASFRAARRVADFVVVNVSSPNTKDLRAIQGPELARVLLGAIMKENDEAKAGARAVPVLVKIAPDLTNDDVDAVCDVAKEVGLAGVVATNTTIARAGLATPAGEVEAIGAGGLSGPPLRARALEVVLRVRARLGKGPCVIGVGGIETGGDARALLDAGADLVQLYTGFIYRGPLAAWSIGRELSATEPRRRA